MAKKKRGGLEVIPGGKQGVPKGAVRFRLEGEAFEFALEELKEIVELTKPKRGPGRPKIEFDLAQVERLASLGCTDEEIAAWFSCSVDTITRRKKEDQDFAEALERGAAGGKTSLRRAQFVKALAGNTEMLKWLGKNILGQSEKVTTERSLEDLPILVIGEEDLEEVEE